MSVPQEASEYRGTAADADAPSYRLPLSDVLAGWRPGTGPKAWTWDDEERDLLARECLCCGVPGHYQRTLEAHLRQRGQIEQPICLGPGIVYDGHHRIIAARRLGFGSVPVEADPA